MSNLPTPRKKRRSGHALLQICDVATYLSLHGYCTPLMSWSKVLQNSDKGSSSLPAASSACMGTTAVTPQSCRLPPLACTSLLLAGGVASSGFVSARSRLLLPD